MGKLVLNVGTTNNDKTGDTLRAGGLKIKANFEEIYNALASDGVSISGGNLLKTGDYSDLRNTPDFSTVAITGNFFDLEARPDIGIFVGEPPNDLGVDGHVAGNVAFGANNFYVCREDYIEQDQFTNFVFQHEEDRVDYSLQAIFSNDSNIITLKPGTAENGTHLVPSVDWIVTDGTTTRTIVMVSEEVDESGLYYLCTLDDTFTSVADTYYKVGFQAPAGTHVFCSQWKPEYQGLVDAHVLNQGAHLYVTYDGYGRNVTHVVHDSIDNEITISYEAGSKIADYAGIIVKLDQPKIWKSIPFAPIYGDPFPSGGDANLGSFKISGSTLGTTSDGGWGGSSINISPNGEGSAWIAIPNDANAASGAATTIGNQQSGGVQIYTGTSYWNFNSDGTLQVPSLSVDLHNGGSQTGQVLQLGHPAQQTIITGPTPAENAHAQRLIIQGQKATGTGEGGDVYFWAGDSQVNGGDIKIYAGDADSNTNGYGGYINIDAGNGFNEGGNLSISAGQSNGDADSTFGGGLSLRAGASYRNAGGVMIESGGVYNALGTPGDIKLGVYNASNIRRDWTFSSDGAITFPDGSVQTTAYAGSVSKYVMINQVGTVWGSDDGENWVGPYDTALNLGKVAVGPDMVVYIAGITDGDSLYYTTAWNVAPTQITDPAISEWNQVRYFADIGRFVAVGQIDGVPTYKHSANGIDWTVVSIDNAWASAINGTGYGAAGFSDIATNGTGFLLTTENTVLGSFYTTTLTTNININDSHWLDDAQNFTRVVYSTHGLFTGWFAFGQGNTSAGDGWWYNSSFSPSGGAFSNSWGISDISQAFAAEVNYQPGWSELTIGNFGGTDTIVIATTSGQILYWPAEPAGPYISIPKPFTNDTFTISNANPAVINWGGGETSVTGEKIIITGAGEFNGTFFVDSGGILYTDTALESGLDSSGFAPFAAGGTVTLSHGMYIDALNYVNGNFYIGNDSEEVFVSTNGGMNWTQVASLTGPAGEGEGLGFMNDIDGYATSGVGLNTGDITFNGVQIIGGGTASGDGFGYSTIELVPDDNLYTISPGGAYGSSGGQYLIIDPTSPQHVHIRAGGPIDEAAAVLILGGEKANVTVRDQDNSYSENHHVTINTAANDSTTYDWKFGNDGHLVLPAGKTIKDTDGTNLLANYVGQQNFLIDGVTTSYSPTTVNFSLIDVQPAIGYLGSDTHTINLPAASGGQRLTIINHSTLCTIDLTGIDSIYANHILPNTVAQLICVVNPYGGNAWWPLSGVTFD